MYFGIFCKISTNWCLRIVNYLTLLTNKNAQNKYGVGTTRRFIWFQLMWHVLCEYSFFCIINQTVKLLFHSPILPIKSKTITPKYTISTKIALIYHQMRSMDWLQHVWNCFVYLIVMYVLFYFSLLYAVQTFSSENDLFLKLNL